LPQKVPKRARKKQMLRCFFRANAQATVNTG
jgi:hypothetical protein